MPDDNILSALNTKEGERVARKACEKHGFTFDQLLSLVEAEINKSGGARRRALFGAFDEILPAKNNVD